MSLTRQQIDQYHEHGYVAGPRVLSDEMVNTLKSRIDDILAGRVDFPDGLLGETVDRSSAKGQLPSVKIVNIFRHDPVFAQVPKTPEIGEACACLFEPPVRVWEDQIIFKPAFDSKAMLNWHQDYTYWSQAGPSDMGTCWIALDDAKIDNGCMYVVPGSHRWDLDYTRDDVDAADPDWLFKLPGVPKEPGVMPVPCEVKAGHCHFHHCKTFHGSYGNKTSNPRRSYILHVMPGYTRRIGDNWNDRQADIECVEVGQVIEGATYPELVLPQTA